MAKGTRYFRKGNDIKSYSGEDLTVEERDDLRKGNWRCIDKDEYSRLLADQNNTYKPTVKLEHGTNINV